MGTWRIKREKVRYKEWTRVFKEWERRRVGGCGRLERGASIGKWEGSSPYRYGYKYIKKE